MKTVKELVDESITPEAIAHKKAFAEHWGVKDDIEFYSDVVGHMESFISAKSTELKIHGDNSIGNNGMLVSIHDSFMIRTKAMYATFAVFKEELMHSNGQLLYPEAGWNLVGEGDIPWQNQILKECDKDNIKFETIRASSNYWNFKTQRREFKLHWIYRMRTKDNCWMSFEAPQEGCHVVYVKMFKTPKEKRRNCFFTLKRFKRFVEILWQLPEIHTVRSPCLAGPEEDDDPEKDSWRFEKMNLGGRFEDTFALMVFWHRLGGINIRIEGENLDELYFMEYEAALDIKEMFLDEGKENPFKLLSPFSIYTREQFKVLTS
mgnify:CR=1 FL=1|tara:strand:+ start:2740 stop:3696 length:957 start_codon:yes stop_codon:yes gene_type:complete